MATFEAVVHHDVQPSTDPDEAGEQGERESNPPAHQTGEPVRGARELSLPRAPAPSDTLPADHQIKRRDQVPAHQHRQVDDRSHVDDDPQDDQRHLDQTGESPAEERLARNARPGRWAAHDRSFTVGFAPHFGDQPFGTVTRDDRSLSRLDSGVVRDGAPPRGCAAACHTSRTTMPVWEIAHVTDIPPRRTQEQRRAETERRVLDAAIALIARTGSRGVTLAQVGEAAGYSRGIVYHQFGSRERLLEAVVDEARRFDVPEYQGNGLEHLVRIVEAYVRNVAKRTPSARAFLQLWGEAIAADPAVMPLFAQRDADFRQFLAAVVRQGVADGSIRDDVDPAAAAVLLLAMVRGTGLQLIAEPPVRNLPALVREATRSVRAAFRVMP